MVAGLVLLVRFATLSLVLLGTVWLLPGMLVVRLVVVALRLLLRLVLLPMVAGLVLLVRFATLSLVLLGTVR
jgi:hypothetical protein